MRRTVLLAGGLPFISAFFGTVLAIGIMVPSMVPRVVQAEQSRIRAEQLTIVGDGGDDRIRLQSGPALRASVSVLDPAGQERALLSTSNPAGTNPEAVAVQLYASDGAPVGRFGVGDGPFGDDNRRINLVLGDRQGHARLVAALDDDGTPGIRLLDADGSVIWSAP